MQRQSRSVQETRSTVDETDELATVLAAVQECLLGGASGVCSVCAKRNSRRGHHAESNRARGMVL
jgi:hypothetical protein